MSNKKATGMKRRIVLVHPRGSNWLKGSKDIVASANRIIPHGILSIAAWLEKEGHEVFVYDCLGPYASTDFQANINFPLQLHLSRMRPIWRLLLKRPILK